MFVSYIVSETDIVNSKNEVFMIVSFRNERRREYEIYVSGLSASCMYTYVRTYNAPAYCHPVRASYCIHIRARDDEE